MNYAEKIVKGSAIVLLMHLAGGLIAYGLRLFLARSLTVAEFGLLYAVLSFVGFLTLFRDLGFGPTLAKFIAEFSAKHDLRSIKSSIIIVVATEIVAGITLVLFVLVLADYISAYYFKADASLPLKIIVTSFAISGFIAMQYIFQGLGNMKYYALVEPVRNSITLAATILMIGLGVVGVAYAYLAAAIITSVAIFFMMIRVFPFLSVKAKITRPLTGKLFAFSSVVFLTSIGGTILGYTDTLTITYFLSVTDVGLYQAALPTAQILWAIVGSVTVILLPIASALWAKNDRETLSRIISLLLKFSFVMIIPFVIIIMAFPNMAIRLLFGEAYLGAALSLQLLVLASLFYTIFAIASSSLFGIGKPSENTKIVFFIAVINLVLNIILIPVFGIVGAATTTLFSYFIGSIISIRRLKQNIQFGFNWASMVKAFAGGILTFALVTSIKAILVLNPWVELVIVAAAATIIYTSYIIVFRVISKDEIRLLGKIGVPIPPILVRMFKKL